MRFWSRKTSTPSPFVKQTRNNNKIHNRDLFKQRRMFSNPMEEESYDTGGADMGSHQWQAVIEPEDASKGGNQETGESLGIHARTYTITNLTTDRSYNANSTTTAELADVLGTHIGDTADRLKRIEDKLRELSRA